MRFFVQCLVIFLGLSILLTIGGELLLENDLPLAITILLGSFTSLLLTILYGWVDAVYIHKRAPSSRSQKNIL